MKKLSLFFILIGCAFLSACDNDFEDPFSGNDNFITSFALTSEGVTVNAAILEDEIIFTAPANFLFNEASVKAVVSENATVMPDPASITDWSSEQVFVVTAFKGEKRTYLYKVAEGGSISDGSVVLQTQADVDALGQSGVTEVKGNLIIGAASGRDLITSLEPLNSIKQIGYGLIIKATYANESIDGLTALQAIGGTLRIESSGLKNAIFSALKSVGTVEVESKTLEKLELPKLTEVANNLKFTIRDLSKINAPLLETVGGSIAFTVSDLQNDKSMLQEISFPSLKSISEELMVGYQTNIGKINLPELTSCGAFAINQSASLTVLSVKTPKLEECKGKLYYNNVPKIQELTLPSLTSLGSLEINNCGDMEEISMPKLKEVAGDFKPGVFTNIAPDGFKKFEALSSIGGAFEIRYGYETILKTLSLPPALKTCQILILNDCATVEKIDITGIEIGELVLSRATLLNLTIKGDQVFKGAIHVDGHENSNIATLPYQFKMPKFEGIKEVNTLKISPNYSGFMADITIAGITKVNGDFIVAGNGGRAIEKFVVQSITEIGGNLTTHAMGADCNFEFTALKKVGGNLNLGDIVSLPIDCKKISFPLLSDAGDVIINMHMKGAEKILMPELMTIRGQLKIICSRTNSSLSNLDGFSKLKTVNNIHIENMGTLESYKGLKNCMNSLANEDLWQLINNLYNPSLADMKAGKWDKE